MYVPIIVMFFIICFTAVLLNRLVVKGKLHRQDKRYRVINFLGTYLPMFSSLIYYAYQKTDTPQETFITAALFLGCSLIVILQAKGREYRFNYLTIALTMFSVFFLLKYSNRFLLSSFNQTFLMGLMGSLIGTNISVKNNKYKVIISSIVTALVIAALPLSLLHLDTVSKPERIALEYAKEQGYAISAANYLFFYGSSEVRWRHSPLELTLWQFEGDYQLKHILHLTYDKSEIIAWSVEQ